jgi:hypothetical protein
VTDRFEVRKQVLHGQAGWVPWDTQKNRPGSSWSPSHERVAAWCRRENDGTVSDPGYGESRKKDWTGTPRA